MRARLSRQATAPRVQGRLIASSLQGVVLVLTGDRGSGKTLTCQRMVQVAASRGLVTAGVVSPGLFRLGEKVGITAVDLRSGETRELARRQREPQPNCLGWDFDEGALAWSDVVVAAAPPCDLLVIDELGPLEIELGKGMTSAFAVLRERRYRLAVVVVRPALIDAFRVKLGMRFSVRTVEKLPAEIEGDPRKIELPWFEEYLRG
jgi:nucleoside-triphosphatase THEP1